MALAHSYSYSHLILLLFTLQCTTTLQHQITTVDLQVLREIKTSLYGPHFFSTWNFASPNPCSTFAGITCSPSNQVDSLQLGPNLSGSLSLPSLSLLSELSQFVLSPGSVTGPIPPQLGSLTNLRVISLTKNRLTGSIPEFIFYLPNLHTLDLSYNLLTGSVPPCFTTLNRLKVLILASNQLSGPVPKFLPSQLLHADLKNNRFTGKIPNQMPVSLHYLSLSSNELVGPITGIVSLLELVYLDLSMNQLSGLIPGPLFHLSLSTILLQRNNFTGTLPVVIPSPSSFSPSSLYGPGSIVDLSHNAISGKLSPVFADVETIFLNNNRITGTVPVEYVNSVSSGRTKTLYLQHNFLSGVPDEKPGRGGWLNSATVCLSYNCLMPPVEMTTCPSRAGGQLSRPVNQCFVFNNGSSING